MSGPPRLLPLSPERPPLPPLLLPRPPRPPPALPPPLPAPPARPEADEEEKEEEGCCQLRCPACVSRGSGEATTMRSRCSTLVPPLRLIRASSRSCSDSSSSPSSSASRPVNRAPPPEAATAALSALISSSVRSCHCPGAPSPSSVMPRTETRWSPMTWRQQEMDVVPLKEGRQPLESENMATGTAEDGGGRERGKGNEDVVVASVESVERGEERVERWIWWRW